MADEPANEDRPYYRFPGIVAKTYKTEYVARLREEHAELVEALTRLVENPCFANQRNARAIIEKVEK